MRHTLLSLIVLVAGLTLFGGCKEKKQTDDIIATKYIPKKPLPPIAMKVDKPAQGERRYGPGVHRQQHPPGRQARRWLGVLREDVCERLVPFLCGRVVPPERPVGQHPPGRSGGPRAALLGGHRTARRHRRCLCAPAADRQQSGRHQHSPG